MHVIRTESDLQALEDPDLLELIRRRIADTAEYVDHFSELVFFVIVEPGDDMTTVDASLSFSLLANRFDGIAFGEPGFTPSWDVLEEHPGFYELVFVLGQDGQGVTVFVTRGEGVSAELLVMCRDT
jgi:hypothetical protein